MTQRLVSGGPSGRSRLFGLGFAAVLLCGGALAVAQGLNEDGPPPDGAYENVTIDGRTVPMIHVKDDGDTVLVDLDGRKPRLWEEQFKRKGDVPRGMYNIHKTSLNGTETFADLPIDREGLWAIDSHGNISAR